MTALERLRAGSYVASRALALLCRHTCTCVAGGREEEAHADDCGWEALQPTLLGDEELDEPEAPVPPDGEGEASWTRRQA